MREMRGDIAKVVFERAKAGRTWASKTPRVNQVTLDSGGEQLNESSNHIRRIRQKMRNSHFNPVKRFLVRSAGKPWAKVYAEVCASADARSLTGREIRDYVESCVATRCWFEDGKWFSQAAGGSPQAVRGLYVHPSSGLLLRTRN